MRFSRFGSSVRVVSCRSVWCTAAALHLLSANASAQLRELVVGPVLVDTETDSAIASASQLSRLTVDGIIVADLQSQVLFALDRTGKRQWRAGRRGEGPAESRAMGSVWVTKQEVFLDDPTLRRISIFDRLSGRYLRAEVRPMPSEAVQRVGRTNVSLGGAKGCRLWVVTMRNAGSMPAAGIVAEGRDGRATVISRTPDSVYAFQVNFEGRPFSFWHSYPPAPIPGWDMSNASVMVVRRAHIAPSRVEVELGRVDACGQAVGAPRTYSLEAVPFPSGQRERLVQAWVDAGARGGMSKGAIVSLAEKRLRMPVAHPPLMTLAVGSDGRAFGRRSGDLYETTGGATKRWVIFPLEGASGKPVEFLTGAATTVLDVMGHTVLLRELPQGPTGQEILRIGTIM